MAMKTSEKIGVRRQTVTPSMAQSWLDATSIRNRNLNTQAVNRIASDILAGRFDSDVVNPIRFNSRGELTDGQHRLSALVKSDRPVDLWVEVTDSVHIDEARPRSVADVLTMRGDAMAKNLQTLATSILRVESVRSSDSQWTSSTARLLFSRSALIEFIESTPSVREFATEALRIYQIQPRFGRAFGPASCGTIMYYAQRDIGSAEPAMMMMTSLASGIDRGKGDPVFAVRRYLQSLSTWERVQIEVPAMFHTLRCLLSGRKVDIYRTNMLGDVSKLIGN